MQDSSLRTLIALAIVALLMALAADAALRLPIGPCYAAAITAAARTTATNRLFA